MENSFITCTGRLVLIIACLGIFGQNCLWSQQPPAAGQNAPAAAPPAAASSSGSAAPAAAPAAPPSEAPKRSQNELEQLVAPIALFPDPLIAVVLPASAYPLEIVQAARFVADTNNLAKLDAQPWDDNVKAVARYSDVISQMDKNISWTSDLGDAFINQSKEVMDAIQTMRNKAQGSGALKTTEQQTVTVNNTIVTNVVHSESVYVTNTVVQIEPSQPDVIYVPQYSPTVVYAGYPAYPGYVYPAPYYYPGAVAAASIVSFGAGMAMGAWMANGCNWGHGDIDVDVNHNYNRNSNVNRDVNRNTDRNRTSNTDRAANRSGGGGQKWQPDSNRLKNSGSSMSSAQSREARGWGSGNNQAGNRAGTTQAGAANRAGTGQSGNRAGTTQAGAANRAGTGQAGAANRAAGGAGASAGTRPSTANTGNRSAGGASASTANRGGNVSSTGARSGAGSTSQSRPSSSTSSSSGGSAFSGGSGSSARSSSARGASSRSSGGARGGGGGRGGGGRR